MNNIDNVEAVGRMQDYIEEHIDDPITMIDLARASSYSPYYAERIFKEYVGKTPFEYIRMLRLTEAARTLRGTSKTVLDISLEYLFDSHEGFTRAFAKQFGVTPKRYQQSPTPIQYFIPYNITYLYKYKGEKENMKETNTKAIFVQIMDRPNRKLILKRGIKADEYFAYCYEVGCDVWGILESIPNALFEPVGMWLPKAMIKKGTSQYVQGVEVASDYTGVIPDGFDVIDLPASQVMIFQGEPYNDEDFEKVVSATMEDIKKFDPLTYGYEFDKSQPRFQLSPQGYRGYIEGWPVKKVK